MKKAVKTACKVPSGIKKEKKTQTDITHQTMMPKSEGTQWQSVLQSGTTWQGDGLVNIRLFVGVLVPYYWCDTDDSERHTCPLQLGRDPPSSAHHADGSGTASSGGSAGQFSMLPETLESHSMVPGRFPLTSSHRHLAFFGQIPHRGRWH